MPLPKGPGIAISVDYFGPLPVTPRGNTYILRIIDRFSRRADMFAVTAAEFTADATANILATQCIPLWGCPRTILSDNDLQFFSKLSQAVYQLLGVRKLATSSCHPNGNGGVEWVNHTMAKCWLWLSMNDNTTGTCSSLTSSSHTAMRSARRRVWHPTRFTWADIHVSL